MLVDHLWCLILATVYTGEWGMLKLFLKSFLSLIIILGAFTTVVQDDYQKDMTELLTVEIMSMLFTNKASASTISICSFLLLVSLPTTSYLRNSSTEGFSNVLMLSYCHAMCKLLCGHFLFWCAINMYSVVSDSYQWQWQKDDALPVLFPPILYHLLFHHTAIILQ